MPLVPVNKADALFFLPLAHVPARTHACEMQYSEVIEIVIHEVTSAISLIANLAVLALPLVAGQRRKLIFKNVPHEIALVIDEAEKGDRLIR